MRRVPAGATAAVAAAGGYAALYRLGQAWGATRRERRRVLPGDELLPHARPFTTHAITVAAPAHHVWPWLVQMGWGGPAGTPTGGSTGGRPRSRRSTRGRLLVHRGTAGAGPAAGAAVDPAPTGVVAAARPGDGVELELAPR
jgi:hypothetical protein